MNQCIVIFILVWWFYSFGGVRSRDDIKCWEEFSKNDANSFLSSGKRSTPKECCLETACERRGAQCYTEQFRSYIKRTNPSFTCPIPNDDVKITSWCPDHYNYECADVCQGLDQNRCANGGTCVSNGLSWHCICGAGYAGTICQIDRCYSLDQDFCANGGTCVFNASSWHCNCRPGFEGPLCENASADKECDSNPCQNGGSCHQMTNAYTCTCTPGFTGHSCESASADKECDSNPCQNGGSCHQMTNAYTCTCAPGFTGHSCESVIRECDSNPCQNDGTCNQMTNAYTCTCVRDFTGDNCEKASVYRVCDINPCQNGGTCIQRPGTYDCTCAQRYAGDNCDKDLLTLNDITCRTGVDHSCYIVFRVKDTWQGAQDFCTARNGHLAVPDDMDEQLFLENYLESMRVRYHDTIFWIGGKKSGINSPQWVSGNKHSINRWPIGVPDNVTGTQCLAMDGTYGFQWQAFPCDRQSFYVCEEIVPFQIVG